MNRSDLLQQQTRDAIAEMRVTPDGLLHMEHQSLGYGSIHWESITSKTLVLHRENAEPDLYFPGADALIEAGWAID